MWIVRQYSQTNISKRVHDTYAWQCEKMARSVFASCPYFRDLDGRELKGLLVIISKVIISLLMVSRGIIPFEKHIVAIGTTSNNMLSKRKTLVEGSL